MHKLNKTEQDQLKDQTAIEAILQRREVGYVRSVGYLEHEA